jgi:hypothetical protein
MAKTYQRKGDMQKVFPAAPWLRTGVRGRAENDGEEEAVESYRSPRRWR